MTKTVLITGASSGIGKACALFFAKNGWKVAATVRKPEAGKIFDEFENIFPVIMDVTSKESIASAIETTIQKLGQIDVLINNAGYYSIGVLESIDEAEIEREIATNLTGLIWVTKAVVPFMRQKKSGRIINIASVAGRTTVPLQSIYHATKWGVEGFTQSLQFELSECGIDVTLVEPGVINTDFYTRSMAYSFDNSLTEYAKMSSSVSNYLIEGGKNGSSAEAAAMDIYKIASAKKVKLHYPIGKSTGIIWLHKLLPRKVYVSAIKSTMMK